MTKMGEVTADLLFLGLTRTPLVLGVAYLPVLANITLCMLYFLATKDLRAFFAIPLIHGAFYILTKKDPLFMELFMVKLRYCNKCRNRLFHSSTNSYSFL